MRYMYLLNTLYLNKKVSNDFMNRKKLNFYHVFKYLICVVSLSFPNIQ